MIRLVCTNGDMETDSDFKKYICNIASQTIVRQLENIFVDEESTLEFFEACYGKEFFEGLGIIYNMKDEVAGYTILDKKVNRMIEKLYDSSAIYTFDVLEERIFFDAICECKVKYDLALKENINLINERQENAIVNVMKNKFQMEEEKARSYVKDLVRMWTIADIDMNEEDEDEREEDSLFFWDCDYLTYFEEGFVKGIKSLAGPVGDGRGYGYDYVVEMFEDIGLKAPEAWIGTKTANEIYQAEKEQIQREIAKALDAEMNENNGM